jgi:hypothetical protein
MGKLIISSTKRNKINESVNTYPSLNKATKYLDPSLISNLNNGNNRGLQRKGFKNLNEKLKNSILDNRINSDTLHQQDQKHLVEKNAENTE